MFVIFLKQLNYRNFAANFQEMIKMKHLILWASLAVMAISLVACKEQNDESADSEAVAMKYVDKIEKNTIFFEDGTTFPIDEKKYNKTFVLIRHAEKDTADKGPDPALTDAGLARSARLADIFRGFRLDAIYSTFFTRTLYTVDSLADIKGLPTYPYDNKTLKETVAKIRESLDQHNVLIVGHSNTMPVLANYILGENKYNQVWTEDDYDNMIIIFENLDSTKTYLPLKYK